MDLTTMSDEGRGSARIRAASVGFATTDCV